MCFIQVIICGNLKTQEINSNLVNEKPICLDLMKQPQFLNPVNFMVITRMYVSLVFSKALPVKCYISGMFH